MADLSQSVAWQRCPICEGCGTVPHDFYARLGVSTSTARERCQRCSGLGTIVLPSWPTEFDMETERQKYRVFALNVHRLNVDWEALRRDCGDPKCSGDCRYVDDVLAAISEILNA